MAFTSSPILATRGLASRWQTTRATQPNGRRKSAESGRAAERRRSPGTVMSRPGRHVRRTMTTGWIGACILLASYGVLQGCSPPFHTRQVRLYDGSQPDSATARITTYDRCHTPRLLAVDGHVLDYDLIGFRPWKIVVSVLPGSHLLDVAWMDCNLQNQPWQRSGPCTMKLLVEGGRDYEFHWERPPWNGGDFEVWVTAAGAASDAQRLATCRNVTAW